MISVFDIYKIGIGPSSSHTVGPMKASYVFINELIKKNLINKITKIKVHIYGSLALTGKGHATDTSIMLGLSGNLPDSVDIDNIPNIINKIKETNKLLIFNKFIINFLVKDCLIFHYDEILPLHENGMKFEAYQDDNSLYTKVYYSIGGGFIVDEENFDKPSKSEINSPPYPFSSALELISICNKNNISIAQLVEKNELVIHSKKEINSYFKKILFTINDAIKNGMNSTQQFLPGPYKVPRRANLLYKQLKKNRNNLKNDPLAVIDWINLYALSVSEENAAGGRVVTAPTNGACGIIPAVITYYDKYIEKINSKNFLKFFFTSAAIGILYKKNASISGAEVGCQGEVGVACSMAAAGLAELFDLSVEKVCMAAEIAMEHNLGLTCDPINGQVQIPCIERNAIAAVKAVNATRLAMRRDTIPKVSLDEVIETMYETGRDMNVKYRETSKGGLAINIYPCN